MYPFFFIWLHVGVFIVIQETALNHVWMSGLLSNGFGATHGMVRNNLIWVVSRMQVQVDHYPIWLVLYIILLYFLMIYVFKWLKALDWQPLNFLIMSFFSPLFSHPFQWYVCCPSVRCPKYNYLHLFSL